MSFGVSECPSCGTGYRYVNGEAIAEVDDDESGEGDDEAEEPAPPKPPSGIDASRTAGVLFFIDSFVRTGKDIYGPYAFELDYRAVFPAIQALIGVGLLLFRQRLVPVALGFVLLTDADPFTSYVLNFGSRFALLESFDVYFYPLFAGALIGTVHSVPATLLLVGKPEFGRYLTGVVIFVLYQAAAVASWYLFLAMLPRR
jgi:hypothetical protein